MSFIQSFKGVRSAAIIVFCLTILPHLSFASNKVDVGDTVITTGKWKTNGRTTLSFRNNSNIACPNMDKGLKGLVIAKSGSGVQVFFPANQIDEKCNKKIMLKNPLTNKMIGGTVWIYNDGTYLKKIPATKESLEASGRDAIQFCGMKSTGLGARETEKFLRLQKQVEKMSESLSSCSLAGLDGPVLLSRLSTYKSKKCSMSNIRAIARVADQKNRRRGKDGINCAKYYKDLASKTSPWKGKDYYQRMNEMWRIGNRFKKKSKTYFQVPMSAIFCIAAKENPSLEPVRMSNSSCKSSKATDAGVGQAIKSSFEFYWGHRNFAKLTPPFSDKHFSKKPIKVQARLAWETFLYHPELQIEMIFAILISKPGNKWLGKFTNYNGSAKKHSYGRKVNTCFNCLQRYGVSKFDRTKPLSTTRLDGMNKCFSAHVSNVKKISNYWGSSK